MVILIMGVAGAGKTTVGRLLASQLGWNFVDGDSFHSPENISKMHAGIALTDADRAPWLAAIRDAIADWVRTKRDVVLASSSLKKAYRDELIFSSEVRLVYLRANPNLVRDRLLHRSNHYMNPALVDSQFADLEEPADGIIAEASQPPADIVKGIRAQLNL